MRTLISELVRVLILDFKHLKLFKLSMLMSIKIVKNYNYNFFVNELIKFYI
jgi:hypothetical protein